MTGGKGQPAGASALLTICELLTAEASDIVSGDLALEIALSDGGNAVFLSDPERGGFCAGGITDNAAPELIETLGAAMEKLGLPMFSIPVEKATDPLAEVIRQYEKGKQA